MKISRADGIAMMYHCGYRDFDKWNNEKFADKLQCLPDSYDPASKPCEDVRVKNLLDVCTDHVRGGGTFEMYDDEPKSAETAETVVTTTTVTTTTTKESADAAPADKPAEVATETVTAETDAPAKPKRLKKTKAEKAAEAKAKAAEKKANAKAKAEAKKAEKAAAKKEKAVTTASGEKKPRKPRASKGGLAKVRDVREGVFYLSGAVIKEFGHTKGISEELIGKFRALRGGLQTKHDIVNYLTRSWHVINGYLHGYTEAMNVKYAEFVEHAEKVADAVVEAAPADEKPAEATDEAAKTATVAVPAKEAEPALAAAT
jgi:outer membrane biosynthesis protein TonB